MVSFDIHVKSQYNEKNFNTMKERQITLVKRYLLSSVELYVYTSAYEEVFYTVDNNLNLVSIGGVKDFTKGFNADTLATIDNNK